MARKLDGRVALVHAERGGIGHSVALALGAAGVHVLVTGADERALGETVGELAHAGAKARHLAGDVRSGDHVARAIERALEVFGRLDFVVAESGELLDHAGARLGPDGCVLAIGAEAATIARHRASCIALVAAASVPPEQVAVLAVALLSGEGLAGRTVNVA